MKIKIIKWFKEVKINPIFIYLFLIVSLIALFYIQFYQLNGQIRVTTDYVNSHCYKDDNNVYNCDNPQLTDAIIKNWFKNANSKHKELSIYMYSAFILLTLKIFYDIFSYFYNKNKNKIENEQQIP